MELISKIINKDIPIIQDKYLNILILDVKLLLIGLYSLFNYTFKKRFKKELIIDLRDIITEYNKSTSIIYLTQLKNGNLAVAINKSKLYFIKLSHNSYELMGKLVSRNP